MITLHNLVYTRGHRIAWLLEELGVEYEIKNYHRDSKTYQVPKEFSDVHPLALSPVITDGDVKLSESGAIMEYILNKYGNGELVPKMLTPEWTQYIYWWHASEATFMGVLFVKRILNKAQEVSKFPDKMVLGMVKKKLNAVLLDHRMASPLDLAEETLKKQKWFAGDEFTAADIMMSVPLIFCRNMGELGSGYPKIKEFIKRVEERPAFQRANEKAYPIELGWVD